MTVHQILLPAGWPRPKGYSNGVTARGRAVFTAGVVGWDEHGRFAGEGLVAQFDQILKNILAILAEAEARPEHIVRMTWFVTDVAEYRAGLDEIGAIWRSRMGKCYPAMAVMEVSALVEPAARIEIETTAVVPE